jgi:hypothetical protein
MGSSIGKVFDYLVTGLLPKAQAIAPGVEVADDLPQAYTDDLIVIGRESPESTDSGSPALVYGALGQTRLDESYIVPGHVYAVRPGPGVKDARDAAVALLDVVIKFVHTDPTLGGLLNRRAELGQMTLTQSGDPGDTGAEAWCSISFGIAVTNTYIP